MLSDVERACGTALAALVQARGQELVDLSLYVSHRNFSMRTRPLLASLLGWPVRYYLPLRARAVACDRTRHLGLAGVDAAPEQQQQQEEKVRGRNNSSSSSSSTQPLSGGGPVSQTAAATLLKDSAPNIRLAALCDELLGALTRQLGQKRYLLSGETYATVDCVAVGYLALLLLPDMPRCFARDAMRRHPRVGAYVNDLRAKFLGGDSGSLPWGSPERGDLPWLGGVLLDAVTDALPWSGRANGAAEPTDDDDDDDPAKSRAEQQQRAERWKSVGFVAGGVLSLVGYAVWSGVMAFPGMHGEDVQLEGENERAEDVGEEADLSGEEQK